MLAAGECFRAIKPVELGPVLAVLDRLQFISIGGSSPEKYKCDVLLAPHFPPALNELVASLALGGHLARAVLRRLAPRQSIPAHIDQWMPEQADWRRFQVPLTSHPAIVMRWPDDNVSVHLEPGWLYEVRFDRTHEVIHAADCSRVHLQIDQIAATI